MVTKLLDKHVQDKINEAEEVVGKWLMEANTKVFNWVRSKSKQ